jgi:Fic family protein
MRVKEVYIWQKSGWPRFWWQQEALLGPLSAVRNKQGRLMGSMEALGMMNQEEALLQNLTADVLKTSDIEGEVLSNNEVRSSIARRLGIAVDENTVPGRHVEGIVEITLDACSRFAEPLSKQRLCNWHAALFPTGRNGMFAITVGDWRKDEKGPMQVVSGAMGKEKVQFEAPEAAAVEAEMGRFLYWFNTDNTMEPVLKAATAHFWLLTIHPFDDGNGRIARAVADMQLARSDGSPKRFYSMSAQIREQRKGYYDILEKCQQGTLDITAWMLWFLQCLDKALDASALLLESIFAKARFWEAHRHKTLNTRQHTMLNKLLDGFEGKLTSGKWAKITKCSADTALRDIQALIEMNILVRETGGGRSTGYRVNL